MTVTSRIPQFLNITLMRVTVCSIINKNLRYNRELTTMRLERWAGLGYILAE